jgi:hypothetical protein
MSWRWTGVAQMVGPRLTRIENVCGVRCHAPAYLLVGKNNAPRIDVPPRHRRQVHPLPNRVGSDRPSSLPGRRQPTRNFALAASVASRNRSRNEGI